MQELVRLQECSLDLMRRRIDLFLFLNLFILFLALLGLCCRVGFSLVVVSGGHYGVAVLGLLIAMASVVEHRVYVGIVVLALGL